MLDFLVPAWIQNSSFLYIISTIPTTYLPLSLSNFLRPARCRYIHIIPTTHIMSERFPSPSSTMTIHFLCRPPAAPGTPPAMSFLPSDLLLSRLGVGTYIPYLPYIVPYLLCTYLYLYRISFAARLRPPAPRPARCTCFRMYPR